MNETQAKAKATRERNQKVRAEQAEVTRAAQQALKKIFECEDSTAEEVLRAAELYEKLSNSRRF